MAKYEIQRIVCPSCGGSFEIEDIGAGEVKCRYCNTLVSISRINENDGKILVTNTADGKPLANVELPIGWDVANTVVDYQRCTTTYPYAISITFQNEKGSMIVVENGEGFTELGMVGLIGKQPLNTVQRPFILVDQYLDEVALSFSKSQGYKITKVEERKLPLTYEIDKQQELEKTRMKVEAQMNKELASSMMQGQLIGIYTDFMCKVYRLEGEDVKYLALYTKLVGSKAGLRGFGFINNGINAVGQGINNMMNTAKNGMNQARTQAAAQPRTQTTVNTSKGGSLLNKMADSGLLGGMLGRKYRTNGQEQEIVQENVVEENVPETIEPEIEEPRVEQVQKVENTQLIGNLQKPGQGESLNWYTENMFALVATEEEFEAIFENAYKTICSTFAIDQSVIAEQEMMKQQIAMQDQSNIQAQAQREQSNLNAMQAAAQRQRVANQQYVDSMRARSNAQYQSQRDSYNSRVAAQDRMRDARSEATRGVNTYIRPDGTEVEVPVSADTAWINGKGEIVGGSAGFNPGAGWTKMERKN